MMREVPSVPTLSQIQRSTPWVWMSCTDYKCGHHVAITLAWAVIRYGLDTSSDHLRRKARCTKCGKRGALLTTPSWIGTEKGFAAFPTEFAWR